MTSFTQFAHLVQLYHLALMFLLGNSLFWEEAKT